MDKDELKKTLREFLLTDCETDLTSLIGEERKLASDTLKELITEQKKELTDHTDKIISVLAVIYIDSGVDTQDPVQLMYRYIADAYLYKESGVCSKDDLLCGGLKNRYLFDLIEKVRFAKMQRESLRDTASYNRHIEKAISDMRNDLTVLFELQCTLEETESVLEKYLEYNINVNTSRNWLKLNGLAKYEPFRSFLVKSKPQLLNLFKRGSIRPEALKYFIETKDVESIDLYMNTLAETAVETLEKASEMISSDVCFPFDEAFLLSAAKLFAAAPSDVDALIEPFLASEKEAAGNVLRLSEKLFAEDRLHADQLAQIGKAIEEHHVLAYDAANWLR